MNKTLLSLSFIFLCSFVFAKKVKFAVDMRNQTVNATGVHIVGDFQEAAGLGTNFAVLSPMTQVGSSTIYSIVVDIPAFQKYEYKFANGDLFYEVEFVPVESRVGYDFVDNRWLYVDSTANDTTFVGAILYGENAPYGLKMARFIVDLSDEASISSTGVHINGDFNNWGALKTQIISLENNSIFEGIIYLQAPSIQYKFYNGSSSSNSETVPTTCAISSNRLLVLSSDSVLNKVCYSSCVTCVNTAGISENKQLSVSVYPQPMTTSTLVRWEGVAVESAEIVDVTGQRVRLYTNISGSSLLIQRENLKSGIYFLNLEGTTSTVRLIIE
jgi:alpha-amylase